VTDHMFRYSPCRLSYHHFLSNFLPQKVHFRSSWKSQRSSLASPSIVDLFYHLRVQRKLVTQILHVLIDPSYSSSACGPPRSYFVELLTALAALNLEQTGHYKCSMSKNTVCSYHSSLRLQRRQFLLIVYDTLHTWW
jgi:hypothetical protein